MSILRCFRDPAPLRTVAIALLALGAAACNDSTGSDSGPERLLFMTTRDVDARGANPPFESDIYRVNADGTGAENLTQAPGRHMELSLSPNGRRMAFARTCELWVADVDGSDATLLAPAGGATGCNGNPRWSPDGTLLAFLTNREGRTQGGSSGLYDVYVMNADGGNPRKVSGGAQAGFDVRVIGWSPGGKVVFESTEITGGVVSYRVFLVNADGTGVETLWPGTTNRSPAWSPDGSKVAFIRQEGGRGRLYVMNADGSGVLPLTAHAGGDWLPGRTGAGSGTYMDYDPWSPDGNWIAFNYFGSGEIQVVRPDGTGQRQVTTTYAIFNGWSASGGRIAYSAGPVNGTHDVFTINPDGSGTANVTNHPADDRNAVWLPR